MPQYLLHTGRHVGDSPDGKNPNHVYNPGDIVSDDKIDLAATYPEKFAYPGAPPAPNSVAAAETPELLQAQIDNLQARLKAKKAAEAKAPVPGGLSADDVAAIDRMDVAQLKTFAEDEEVDLAAFKSSKPNDKTVTTNELRAYIKSRVTGARQGPAGREG